MDLMEYQAKELFRTYDVRTTLPGEVVADPDEAASAAARLATPVMVKAQVLTGGRGKAGGVRHCRDADAAREATAAILGLDINGHVVEKVLVEPATDIAEEYYLAVLFDRVSRGYKLIASAEGGVDIEAVNRATPEKVVTSDVDPLAGLDAHAAAQLVSAAGYDDAARDDAVELVRALYEGFVAADATLFEVNPLVLTRQGLLVALDAKVSIDDNALFRHEDLVAQAESSVTDPLERQAKARGLQYVHLDGDVGVIGNGAGLVMSTLDVVSEAGGRPANFLDVGGGADADKMAAALSLVLSDEQVACVLINIFGGITRCDEIATGILDALRRLGAVPQTLVVRLDGTNADEGQRILAEADHPNVVPVQNMLDAADRAVELTRRATTASSE